MQITPAQTPLDSSINYLSAVANQIGKVTLKVFDTTSGFIAKTISTHMAQGAQLFDINLDDLSDGTYIINAFCGDKFLRSMKVTKQ